MNNLTFDKPTGKIQADLGAPILFRTTSEQVCQSALDTGSLWLRSDSYYRGLEDKFRNDELEGVSSSKGSIPLRFKSENGPEITFSGGGHIGQVIVTHYLACFHGASLSLDQWQDFGGHSFGVRNFSRLVAEILFRCSKIIGCTGYRYGSVSYQHSVLSHSAHTVGGAAIEISGNPPTYVNPLSTDVLRKQPKPPFILQDEWRVAIFTSGYVDDDPMAPLCINVDPANFYEYPLSASEAEGDDAK